MPLKLYNYWRSSSAYRVRIALALKGLSYEKTAIHLVRGGGEQHADLYKRINPISQVPTLEISENGQHLLIAQSVAIVEYLEERYPEPALLPKDLGSRAQVRELVEIINSGVQPLQNLAVTKFVAELCPGIEPTRWPGHFIKRGLAALEARAETVSGKFLVGDHLSLADVFLVPQLYAARRFAIDPAVYPTLARVEATCTALAPFIEAHPDQQPDAEKA